MGGWRMGGWDKATGFKRSKETTKLTVRKSSSGERVVGLDALELDLRPSWMSDGRGEERTINEQMPRTYSAFQRLAVLAPVTIDRYRE